MRFTVEQAEKLGLVRDASGNWTQGRKAKVDVKPSKAKAVEKEAALHADILKFCRDRGWPCVHSRMDRPATCQVGTPDFAIVMPKGLTLWVEAKAKDGKLTTEQRAWMAAIDRLGHVGGVVRNMEQFRDLVTVAGAL